MTKRQPDSTAVAAARVELTAIVDDLQTIKARVLALARRLKREARTAEVLGTITNDELTLTLYPNGQPYTAEDWFGDNLKVEATGSEGHLREAIGFLARLAHEDHRESARFHVRSMNSEDVA